MKKMSPDMETSTCSSCGKTKVVDIGFYENNKNTCKKCVHLQAKDRDHKNRNWKFERHLYGEEGKDMISQCTRCGVKMKRVANPYKKTWNYYYYINGEWVPKRPECVQVKQNNE